MNFSVFSNMCVGVKVINITFTFILNAKVKLK